MTKRRWSAGIALALVLCGVGGSVYHRVSGTSESTLSASVAEPLALNFEPGSTLRYRVAWSGKQRGRLFATNAGASETHVESATDMALDMALYVEAVHGSEATVVLSFTDVRRQKLEVLGAAAFPDREHAKQALVGRQAKIRIGTDGRSREVAFEAGTPDVFMNIVQWVVAQSSLSLAPSAQGAAWESTERGPFGMSRVLYSRRGAGLERVRSEYVSFDAFANSTDSALHVRELSGKSSLLVRGGKLENVLTEERLRVDGAAGTRELEGSVRFELRLVRVDRGAAAPARVAYGPAESAGEPVVGPETLAKLLEQRVAGMTREDLLRDLQQFGAGGVLPAHTRWLWRATGLLKQDPALASELSRIALQHSATDKTKSLVMDLLASVGHADAQRAMRQILDAPSLARSPVRAALVQRISFLEHPSRETVGAAWAAYEAGKDSGFQDLAVASAHALAASAGAARMSGDEVLAGEIVSELGRQIAAAPDRETQAHLLGALTNARGDEVLAIAKPYAGSEEVALREASAEALRNVHSAESTALLLELIGDSAFPVQSSALASLGTRPLRSSEFRRIQSWLAEGKLGTRLEGALLSLVQSSVGSVPEATSIARSIAEHPAASAATRARARAMLDQAG